MTRRKNIGSNSTSKISRLRDKALRLRERIKQSQVIAFRRHEERIAWWQRAFKTPLVGFYGWVFSRASSLWSAVMALIGLRSVRPAGKNRAVRQSTQVRRSHLRFAMCEGLEPRQLLTAVADTEPNDTLATAQVLIGSNFDLTFNANIENASLVNTSTTIPHAEITGTGNGSFDYYQFTVPAGTIGIFDIDFGDQGAAFTNDASGDVDIELAIWDSAGNVIASNDDSGSLDTGSTSGYDSFIQIVFATGGTYTVGVAEFNSTAVAGGWDGSSSVLDAIAGDVDPAPIGDVAPTGGDTYVLNVSLGAIITPTVSIVANDSFAEEVTSPGTPNNGQFTVNAFPAPVSNLVVSYSIAGDATNGADYKALTGVVTIPAGQTAAVIDLDIIDDLLYDGPLDETVTLTITGAPGYTGLGGAATVQIGDNEVAPTVSITASQASAAEPGTNGEFTITMSGASDTATTVNLSTATGSPATVAVSGTDYTALVASVIIPAGSTSSTAAVTVIDDSLVEGPETVTATIGTITGNGGIVKAAPFSAVVTIADTTDTATISLGAFSAASISEDTGKAKAVISMTGTSSTDTVVKYLLFTGTTAVEGTDYTLGEIDEVENNNTFLGPQPATNGPQGLAGFSIASNGDITGSTSVPHVTITSTAATNSVANRDVYAFYTSTGGASTFDIDNTTGGFNSFLTLYNSSGTVLATSDNAALDTGSSVTDSLISFNLPGAGVYYIEVAAGSTALGTISATGTASNIPVGSGYKLHLSVPGADGYAVIGAGSTSVPLSVQVLADTLVEPTEVVNVRLDSIIQSDPEISFFNASAAHASRNATVSILDNDVATVKATSTKAFEPVTNGVYTFEQTLKSATNTVIKLVMDNGLSTTKSSFNGTPANPADHSLAQTVTVTILAGQTQATLTVPVLDSSLIEEDETLVLNMSLIGSTDPDITIDLAANPGNNALMLFGDEDTAVVDVDATLAPAVEGGQIGKFTFFLSAPPGYPTGKLLTSDRDTVIKYTVGGTATNGTDYATLSGTATIPAFSSTTDIFVDATGVFDDIVLEGTETVSVTITSLETPTDSNIAIGLGSPSDSLTISDNDSLTVKVAATTNAVEGNPGAGSLGVFTFSTSGTGDTGATPTVVTYQVKVSSSTAVEGTDFAPLLGTVTIPAGVAPQSATVAINAAGIYGDLLFEGNETVTLEILTVSGAAGVVEDPVFGEATGLIIDDESGLVTIAKTLDAAEGSSNGLFTVTLGGQSPLPTIVQLEVLPAGVNNATPGVDYTTIGSPYKVITFNPFQTQVTVPVNVIDDGLSEPTESVIVEVDSVLSGPYTASATPATVSIFSNQKVAITASDPTAAEPADNGEFVLSLYTPGFGATTSSSNTVVSFTIASGAGQATNGTDYTTIPLSATILAGQTTVAIPVSVLDDLTLEGSETVTITLTGISAGNGDIAVDTGSKVATVTIADEDQAYVTIKATDPTGSDNPASDDDAQFTVFLSQPSDKATVVNFTVTGTANPSQTPVADYVTIPASITIPAGATSAVIPVDVLNDAIVEGTETVTLNLTGPVVSPYAANIFLGALGSTYLSPGLAQLKFQDAPMGYAGTQDTYLDQASQFNPLANFGNDPDIAVSPDTGLSDARQGLLQFNLSQIPANSPIASAVLDLWATIAIGGPSLTLHQMLQSWSEASTWSNSFGINGIQANGVEAAATGASFATGFGLNSLTSTSFITNVVQGWVNGGANNGWALLPTGGFTDFRSSESGVTTQRPRLTVNLDVSATVNILDTDTAQVNVSGFTLATEPGSNGSIIVSMNNPSSSPVTVFYQDNLTGTAISGSDYVPLPVGPAAFVVIPAGQTSTSIVITPLNDSLVEAPESVNITLLSVSSADPDITLGPTVNGTTNIVDTDFALVTVSGTTNGDENGTPTPIAGLPINGSFTISMSTPSSVNTVLSLAIGGTATNGADYASIPLSVTIPANFLSTTIPVSVIDDLINEAPIETVTLTLTGITAGHLSQTFLGAPVSGTVNIVDDEQPLTVTNVATKAIATEGGPNGEFQFQLNYPSDNPTVITYQLNAGTATVQPNGLLPDFNASALTGSVGPSFTTGTVTIPTGSTTVALPVVAFQDYVMEPGETVNLQITSISNNNPSSIVGTGINTVTIQDVVYTVTVLKTDSPASEPGPPTGSNGQFTFTLSAPLPEPTVVKYAVGGTAIPSPTVSPVPNTADYVGLSGTVTIPANTTEFKLSVDVIDDLIVEGDETIEITLTSASSNGPTYSLPGLGVPTVNVANGPLALQTETIQDNDSATVSIAGVDGTELGQPAGIVGNFPDGKFVISQTKVSSSNTVVTYAVQGTSTATNGTDYTAITGTLTATILAGNTSVSIPVDILQDLTLEGTETVVMKLIATKTTTDPQITIGTNLATVNIVDDDTATVSIVPTGPIGFEPGANDGQYSVILSAPSAVATVVTYSLLAPGPTDATPGSDFTLRDGAMNPIGLLSGSVTIPAGQTSTPIIVDVLDDNIIENNEAVKVQLTGTDNPTKITVNGTPATVTIQDFGSLDQDTGKVTIAKLVDGDESPIGAGKTDGKFLLTLVPTNPFYNVLNGAFSSDENTVVTYSISGGSALNPSDHTLPTTGSVTILAGQTTAILTVPVVDDNVAEVPESLQVTLTGVVAPTHTPAIVADPTPATIAMLDDDVSVLTIGNKTVDEGASGNTAVNFVVTSPNAVAGGFTVLFSVGGGNATLGVDYTLSSVSTGSVLTASTGSLTFAGTAGETETITINFIGDNVVELSETFNVTLGTATPGLPLVQSGAVALGTITNDDTATITISSPSVVEGTDATPGDGPFTTLPFVVSSSNPIDIPYTIDVILADGTAKGVDFDPLFPVPGAVPVNVLTGFDFDNDASNTPAGFLSRVTFPAAAATAGVQPVPANQTINVRIVQDNFVEGGTTNNPGGETISASLADINSPTRSTITTATGTGTITDDDSATVSIAANDNKASEPLDTVNEGNGQFTVTQTALSSSNTVIKYTVSGTATPSGTSALEDDYTALSGTVTILAGQSQAVININVLDNALVEDDETVTITLDSFVSRDPNVSFSGQQSDTVTIFDDDQATVSIKANDPNATEDPLDNGQFTLTLSGISDTNTVIKYAIATGVGQATNGSDYNTLSGTATILAGQTTTTIDVVVIDDATPEGAETVTLTLTSLDTPTNADIKIDSGANSDTVTIAADNDGILVSVFNNGNGTEGGSNGSFLVKITKADGVTPVGAPAGGLTVNYGPFAPGGGGTAVGGPGGDYVALSGSIFIAPGNTTGLIDVSVIDDAVVEATETVNVQLFSFSPFPNATLGTSKAVVNIIDNDKAVFTVDDLVVNEGDGTGTLTVKISNKLEGISVPVTVNYTPLSAGSPSDFSPSGSQTLTFLPGSLASQTVSFTIVDDALVEGLEGFGVSLSSTYVNGPGLHVIDVNDTAVVAIVDNDTPLLAVKGVKVGSGDAGPSGWSDTFDDFVDNTGAPVGQRGYSIPTKFATDQTTVLPWTNIDRLYVEFTQDPDPATLVPANFVLFGLQGASTPTITSVVYDTATNLAKLTLSNSIVNDRLRLQVKDTLTYLGTPLDGEWTTGVSSFVTGAGVSGSGAAGGTFNFLFNVLPGDVNKTENVTVADAGLAFAAQGAFTDGTSAFPAPNTTPYSIFTDLNGSGNITVADAGLAFARQTFPVNVLPAGSPGSATPAIASGNQAVLDALRLQIGEWTPNPIANPEQSEVVPAGQQAAPAVDYFSDDDGYLNDLAAVEELNLELVDAVWADLSNDLDI